MVDEAVDTMTSNTTASESMARVLERYKHLTHRRPRCASNPAAGEGQQHRPASSLMGQAKNPLCGDSLNVVLDIDNQDGALRIVRASFDGFGCSLCMATADLVMEYIEGRRVAEAREVAAGLDARRLSLLWGGLEVAPVREQCLTLAARTLNDMLQDS